MIHMDWDQQPQQRSRQRYRYYNFILYNDSEPGRRMALGRYGTLGLIAGQGVTNWAFRNGAAHRVCAICVACLSLSRSHCSPPPLSPLLLQVHTALPALCHSHRSLRHPRVDPVRGGVSQLLRCRARDAHGFLLPRLPVHPDPRSVEHAAVRLPRTHRRDGARTTRTTQAR